ncbi:lipopolysaccharide biosynthesis protein [Pedobacter petrophilus]|uniref:Lipopolysaccharide biosynthesis protein n=1 Tax=Pedobacter petrophilus TaxID=1908241 RepID=A0A7K0FX21_9SPHI|nr:lipopolysaccharide biosynthesis protein [Pedobacter petrophilus]MRX75750.1 lipopolysaccharide biosynthesis protein [Pedobacter petrophilus]
MNIQEFLNLTRKYKWLIISVPALTLIITFFFIKNLPKEYKSEAKISTGLLDPSRQVANELQGYSGPDVIIKLNQQFTTIIDVMKMPKNMSILSYRLILHDLKNPTAPFKPLSDNLKNLNNAQRQEAINLFESRLIKREALTPLDNGKPMLYDLVMSMGYDAESLNRKLSINHEQNSDFISVDFLSPNTLLSVFVVNTLSSDFINNYSLDQINNKNTSILVLDSLLKKKEAIMNERILQLKDYKIKNGVLNLDKQSQIIYQQITDNENKKSQALIDKQAALAALKSVNNKLDGRYIDKYLGAETIVDNQDIINLKNKIEAAENIYLDGGYKATDKKKVDSLQLLLSAKLLKSNDRYVSDPLIAKQTLVQRRISIGIELEQTTAGIKDIDRELDKLNAKFTGMVPFDAGVQNFERNADVATKEYLEILSRYNQTSLDKNIGLRLQLVQEGVPTRPESSKKPLYLALSVAASFAICFFLLFMIYFLDHSINDAKELKAATKGKVIGELNSIKPKNRDIRKVWLEEHPEEEISLFKDQMRALRFEIDHLLAVGNQKVLGITSIKSSKSPIFTLLSLTYSFASLGKKILLIGDAEIAIELEKLKIPTHQSIGNVLAGSPVVADQSVTFLSNNLGGKSLLEKGHQEGIDQIFNAFNVQFDLILVYLDPVDSLSAVKEWIFFTDRYIALFMAGDSIDGQELEKLVQLNEDQKFTGWVISGVKA